MTRRKKAVRKQSNSSQSVDKSQEEKRRQRRREADKRHYRNNAEVLRERKRLQMQTMRAETKARKRRWDPPKNKTDPEPDADLDDMKLPSPSDEDMPSLTAKEMSVLFEADIWESEGAMPSVPGDSDSDDALSIYEQKTPKRPRSEDRAADSEEGTSALFEDGSNTLTTNPVFKPPRRKKLSALSYYLKYGVPLLSDGIGPSDTEDRLDLAPRGAGPVAIDPEEDPRSAAAEMLVNLAATVQARDRRGYRQSAGINEHEEQSSERAIDNRTVDKDTVDAGAPAVSIVFEEGDTQSNMDVSAPRERVFRGYRYIPTGPPPGERPVIEPRPSYLPASSGICGNCKTVEKCAKDGDDGEGLCERCLDCQMYGYLCWDHFNGVKDWEEPWLW